MLVAESREIVCFNVETEEKTNLTQTTKYQTSGRVFSGLAEVNSVHMIQAAININNEICNSKKSQKSGWREDTIKNARGLHFILWLYSCMTEGHS